ncbi:MAG TPA: hypothetical protein VGI39_41265 [Polyangiaceae bacterium]|jgi:hypothetical protein
MKRGRSWAILFGACAAGCATGSTDGALDDDGGVTQTSDAGTSDPEGGSPAEAAADDAGYKGGAKVPDASIVDGASDSGLQSDAAFPLDAAPPGDAGPAGDANPPPVDLARAATAYTWQSMLSATADTGKLAAPALNDGSLSTQVNIDSSSGDVANAWEGAGVVFANPVTVATVIFAQGKTGGSSSGDGWFEANFGLQVSMDGSSWADSGWSANPPYAYSSAVSDKSFTFTGTALPGIRGVRLVGQVNTVGSSWWEAANEVTVFGP